MILSSIHLKNFRRHRDTHINFSDELNYIVGGNGQGKTSILESIYYLCTTKSYNSKADNEVVNFNTNDFEITGSFKDLTKENIRIYYSLDENKKFYFQNSKQIFRSADVIGKHPVVILTPNDHAITQGGPADRRRFVDSVISQASSTYLKNLLDYNKTLRHRSSLLAQIKETKTKRDFDQLEAWSEKLAAIGVDIINYRKKFINEFCPYVTAAYKNIMDEEENPGIIYQTISSNDNEIDTKTFLNLLGERREEEIRRASNLVGPHRDDFIFEINNVNLKTFGSQGQQKTFQVVLRFAQFFYLKEKTGKTPIFLLDDVFGELDAFRSAKISKSLKSLGQAFITLTDMANFSFLERSGGDKVINITEGRISYA